MSKIIKTSIGLVFFLLTFNLHASCKLTNEKSIYLFSGPVATMLYRLNSFKDENIFGILQSFNFKPKSILSSIQVFEGGIFTSQKVLSSIKSNAIIFMDESKDLEANIQSAKERGKTSWEIVKFISQNKSPDSVARESLEVLRKYLVMDKVCQKRIETIEAQINQYKEKVKTFNIIKKISQNNTPIYFLTGRSVGNKIPPDAIVLYREGFTIDFVSQGMIPPYSEVGADVRYGVWSSKLLNQTNSYKVMIDSQLEDNAQKGWLKLVGKNLFQVECFACLIPGITQLEWILHLKSVTP